MNPLRAIFSVRPEGSWFRISSQLFFIF
jgi:hypothetical protein